MRGVTPEALASRKVVGRDSCTEVSETAKTCTDEQKPDMRLYRLDEVAQHTEVQNVFEADTVDPAGIGRRVFVLPREILTQRKQRRKSAEVIVISSNEPSPQKDKGGGLTH